MISVRNAINLPFPTDNPGAGCWRQRCINSRVVAELQPSAQFRRNFDVDVITQDAEIER